MGNSGNKLLKTVKIFLKPAAKRKRDENRVKSALSLSNKQLLITI